MQGVNRLLDGQPVREALRKGGHRALPAYYPCAAHAASTFIAQPIIDALLDGKITDVSSGLDCLFINAELAQSWSAYLWIRNDALFAHQKSRYMVMHQGNVKLACDDPVEALQALWNCKGNKTPTIQEAVVKGGYRKLPDSYQCGKAMGVSVVEQPVVDALLDGKIVDISDILHCIVCGVNSDDVYMVIRGDYDVKMKGLFRYSAVDSREHYKRRTLYQGDDAAKAVKALIAGDARVVEALSKGGYSSMPPGSKCLEIPGLNFDPRLCRMVARGQAHDATIIQPDGYTDAAVFTCRNAKGNTYMVLSATLSLDGKQVYGTYQMPEMKLKVHTSFDTVVPLLHLEEAVVRGNMVAALHNFPYYKKFKESLKLPPALVNALLNGDIEDISWETDGEAAFSLRGESALTNEYYSTLYAQLDDCEDVISGNIPRYAVIGGHAEIYAGNDPVEALNALRSARVEEAVARGASYANAAKLKDFPFKKHFGDDIDLPDIIASALISGELSDVTCAMDTAAKFCRKGEEEDEDGRFATLYVREAGDPMVIDGTCGLYSVEEAFHMRYEGDNSTEAMRVLRSFPSYPNGGVTEALAKGGKAKGWTLSKTAVYHDPIGLRIEYPFSTHRKGEVGTTDYYLWETPANAHNERARLLCWNTAGEAAEFLAAATTEYANEEDARPWKGITVIPTPSDWSGPRVTPCNRDMMAE